MRPDYSRPLKPERGISLDVRDNGKLYGLLDQQPAASNTQRAGSVPGAAKTLIGSHKA